MILHHITNLQWFCKWWRFIGTTYVVQVYYHYEIRMWGVGNLWFVSSLCQMLFISYYCTKDHHFQIQTYLQIKRNRNILEMRLTWKQLSSQKWGNLWHIILTLPKPPLHNFKYLYVSIVQPTITGISWKLPSVAGTFRYLKFQVPGDISDFLNQLISWNLCMDDWYFIKLVILSIFYTSQTQNCQQIP